MPLPQLPLVALDDPNHRRRSRETINNILTHQFDDSRVQTAAEIAAGVTPVNYAYAPGDPKRQGATGDGTTDDRAAFFRQNSTGEQIRVPGGTYFIGSNLTLSSALVFDKGAILKPDTGVTITVTGDIQAGVYQIFDATLGSFALSAREVYLEWFGGAGDGTYNNFGVGTDNLASWNKAIASLPPSATDGATLRLGSRGTYRFTGEPTLRDDLTILGLTSGIPWNRTPILQYSGSSIFLDLAYQRVNLVGFQVFGNAVNNAVGIRIADQHCAADNISIANFAGTNGCGLRLAPGGGKQTLYFRGGRIWSNSNYNGCEVGDGSGTVNSNTITNLLLSGNSRNGLLINKCNVLRIPWIDCEGNVSGGTGANINLVAGQNILIEGYTEVTSETATKKNLIIPAGSATCNNVYLNIYADGNPGTSFFSETAYSFFLSNPRQVANNEPGRFTAISVNALHTYDPGQNVVAPVLETLNGPVVLGAATSATAASWPSFNMRNARALANNGTLNLTTYLQGAMTSIEGLLFVQSDQDNAAAIFLLKNSTTVEYLDPAAKFSNTAGTASSSNVSFTGGHYELENKAGGARNYSFHLMTLT